MIMVLAISIIQWAALDKSEALQQPQPRMKSKQAKQSKCIHEKNLPTTYLHNYKPTNP